MSEDDARRDPGAQPRILVVEDEAMIRSMLGRMLARQGWAVTLVEDATQARAVFAEAPEHWDALLTDLVMPGESGAELYRALSERRPGLPVVFMSGYSDDYLHALDDPAAPQAFLEKPFDRATLLEKLRSVLPAE